MPAYRYSKKRNLLLCDELHRIIFVYQQYYRIPEKDFTAWHGDGYTELLFITDRGIDPNFLNLCRHHGFHINSIAADLVLNERERFLKSLEIVSDSRGVVLIFPKELTPAINAALDGRPAPQPGQKSQPLKKPEPIPKPARPIAKPEPRPAPAPESLSVSVEPSPPRSRRSGTETAASSAATAATKRARVDFQSSLFTIRVKLLGIISLILISALLGMILLATRYFKADSQARLQEQNLFISRLTATRVELELRNLAFLTRSLARELQNGGSPRASADNQHIVSLAVYPDGVDANRPTLGWINAGTLNRAEITGEELTARLMEHRGDWPDVMAGITILKRLDGKGPIPLFALGLPLDEQGMILTVFSGRQIENSFRTSGSILSYLVDQNARLLAHPDESLLARSPDLSDSPIVRRMRSSAMDNGQFYYEQDGEYHLGSFQKITGFGLGVITTIPEERAFAGVYLIQRRNLLIMTIVLATSILIVVFFSRSMTVPLRRLVQLTRRVEEGDFNQTLEPDSGDEIGELTAAFGHMLEGLGQRDRMKDMLQKFASKEIAEKAMAGELKLGGERKTCVVLFSDLRDFTRLSESMAPEEVLSFLNDYYTDMANWILLSRGTLDKFIGDAMMAWWGAIESEGPEQDAVAAVNAALMMRESLIERNRRRAERGEAILFFGVGVNFGPVVAGQIGGENRYQYTVLGDTVNLASRVEALNVRHGTDILITAAVNELVAGVFQTTPMPDVPIKGKSERVRTFAVLGRRDDPNCPADLASLRERIQIQGEFESTGESELA